MAGLEAWIGGCSYTRAGAHQFYEYISALDSERMKNGQRLYIICIKDLVSET